MSNFNKKVKPFGMADKIGYMFGDFGNDFTFILSSSFLLKFYTDVMGVDATIVGLMMMLSRIVDAFTDVGMDKFVTVVSQQQKENSFLGFVECVVQ